MPTQTDTHPWNRDRGKAQREKPVQREARTRTQITREALRELDSVGSLADLDSSPGFSRDRWREEPA